MIRLLFILGLLFLFQLNGKSQTSQLLISAEQQDVIVHLNNIKQNTNESFTITQGTYLLEAWAPTYQYLRDTILLKAGLDTVIAIRLNHSSAFLQHEKELRNYRFQAIGMRYVAPAAYFGIMGYQLFGLRNLSTELESLQAAALATKTSYDEAVDPAVLSVAANDYALLKERYDADREIYRRRQQTALTTGIVLGLVVVALESIAFRLERPEYNEDTRLSFQPYYSGNAVGIAMSWH